MPEGEPEVKVTVPDLSAGIDIANDRILGQAPAGGELTVSVLEGPGITDALESSTSAGPDGSYAVDLSGIADAQPGHAGDVRWTDEHDNTFHAFFAALAVEVTIGARNVTGTMTPGDTVSVALAAEDGTAKGNSSGQLLGDYVFNLPQNRRDRRNFGPVAVGDEISVTQTSEIPGASITVSRSHRPDHDRQCLAGRQARAGHGRGRGERRSRGDLALRRGRSSWRRPSPTRTASTWPRSRTPTGWGPAGASARPTTSRRACASARSNPSSRCAWACTNRRSRASPIPARRLR